MAGHDMSKEGIEAFLYVLVASPVGSKDELMAMLPKHLEHQVALEKKGILFAAGPLFDEGKDAPVAGLVIIRASSFDEARKIADTDPMMVAGLRTYTLRRWSLNEGGFVMTVSHSDRAAVIT